MAETVQSQSDLKKRIQDYLDYLESDAHFSPLTVRNYKHYLKRFSNFIGKNEVTKELLEKYKKTLSDLGLSSKTLGFHLIAVRSFIKYERKRGKESFNVEEIEIPKVGSSKVDFLEGAEVERLLNAPDIGSLQGKRDRAIMELFYSTGLRVSELAGLDKKDVDFIKKEITVTKNRGKRAVFLSLRASDWIEKYLMSRKDNFSPLFIHHKGKPMEGRTMRLTVRSIQRMFQKYRKKIGLEKTVTPKTLRASFAVDILMAGAEVGNVQKTLGHKNISTTQIYTHVTNRQLRDIHAAFHGHGGK